MKRWALLVTILYCLALAILTVPMILLVVAPAAKWMEAVSVYRFWQYWLGLAVMAAVQAAFLTVPVRVASRRPVTQKSLWPAVLAGGVMMAGLAFGAVCSLY